MTEELNAEVNEEKCNCFYRSEGVKKFVIVALGSFVGVFCALSLFAALHKPPMVKYCPYDPMMRPPVHHGQHFDRGMRRPDGNFHKKFGKENLNREIPVRVEVEKPAR